MEMERESAVRWWGESREMGGGWLDIVLRNYDKYMFFISSNGQN